MTGVDNLETAIARESEEAAAEAHDHKVEALKGALIALEIVQIPGLTLYGTPAKEVFAEKLGLDNPDRIQAGDMVTKRVEAAREAVNEAIAHHAMVSTNARRELAKLDNDPAAETLGAPIEDSRLAGS